MPEDEPIDVGPAAGPQAAGPVEPTFYLDTETDLLSIDWHGDRPETVEVQTDLIDAWIAERNAMTTARNEMSSRLRLYEEKP